MSDQQKQRNWFARHKVLTVILALVVVCIIGGAAGGSSKTDTKKDTANTSPAKEEAKPTPAPAQWDIEAAYAKINNGMTKAQVEEATGQKSSGCTESQIQYVGKTEICSYSGGKGIITVTYTQDVVSSKAKGTF